jgi:hypothetical protein
MSEIVTKDHSMQEPTVAEQHPLETIPQGSQEDGVLNGHDHSDANVDGIFKITAALMALIVGSLIVSWFITTRTLDSLRAADTLPSATYVERPTLKESWPTPPIQAELQPREEMPDLQPDPEKPLLMYRELEDSQLQGTNWVKDEKGRRVAVSIPIEEAMKLTLERGLPTDAEAKVEVRRPTGDVAEMGAIPPSETELNKLIAQDNAAKAGKAGGAQPNQRKTREGMTGAE